MGHVLKRLLHMIRTYAGESPEGQSSSVQIRFSFANKIRLLLLAVGMLGLWYLATPSVLSEEEGRLWERVHAAQLHLSQWRQANGTATSSENDPFNCGLIGLEWSGLTTTLGELSSKRTACNPIWSVQFTRWFHELGLQPGDPVAIYSSASFPGMLLNLIVAAEAMQLEPLLIVSLGASTWGANHPDAPWPVLATELRRNGFISKRADYYTLGGGAELGQGLSPEGDALLREAAKIAGVELLTDASLAGMIKQKTELLKVFEPRVFVSIGGSQANLGDSLDVLQFPTGFIPEGEQSLAGNGVIGFAMQNNIPVIHMLNIKSISDRVGIPYDGKPRKTGPAQVSISWSLIGLVVFFIVLLTHRRWRLEPTEK